ncbi:hypothetical protein MNU35_12180 [Staphylococcus epidermidis]|uniref:hypothetical protein n=1 Tax=Staphylococcus epidermidis TaxID=1282 RepID=UPI00024E4677|nr:hypothetical protein [Staphylococcus epidermidis]EHR97094.1 hypothetical protein SEVCU128_0364 [Staphylococcus epidermidis VCU128]MCG2189280.1 hypothetical protein [Staphylococcus epidermidis]RIL55208.1 hypothetical protein BUY70_11965 [Staphylococcus epidermidis]UTF16886.1 hypothetical protein MNU35_12180 [Staphylococcus epidermidis]
MEHIFDESLTEQEKAHYKRNYLDEYKPKNFNKELYQLLNYEEKQEVIDYEKEIEEVEHGSEMSNDSMNFIHGDLQLLIAEFNAYKLQKSEEYQDV